MPAIILLTATIAPPAGVPALTRTDPRVRTNDYLSALRFYLALPDHAVDRIVFAENSASDLGEFHDLVDRLGGRKAVNLISFDGLQYPAEYGRSYGETILVQSAVERSPLLSGLPAGESFWKLTGRLQVRNLANLVASAPADCDLYADFRRYPRRRLDTRLFACTTTAFQDLFLPRLELMRHDRLEEGGFTSPEERLFDEILAERRRVRIVPRFRVEPVIEGFSGFDTDYGRATRRAWCAARGAVRRLAPSVWI